jgi:alpha-L-fucosidase 2
MKSHSLFHTYRNPLTALIVLALVSCSSPVQGQTSAAQDEGLHRVRRYNVEWTGPSDGPLGSMPLGNGDITVNAWVDRSGTLSWYIGKSDSWGDNGRLLKVGRLDLSFFPRPDTPLTNFHQVLRLDQGSMEVRFGRPGRSVSILIWVDARQPLIHLEATSDQPTIANLAISLWRMRPDTLSSLEVSDVFYNHEHTDGHKNLTIVEPDSLVSPDGRTIGWFHRNIKSIGPALTAGMQGVREFRRRDPLLHRSFGALMTGQGARRRDSTHLVSLSSTRHEFLICVTTRDSSTSAGWLRETGRQLSTAQRRSLNRQWSGHLSWWRQFWNRSWIDVTAESADSAGGDDAFVVSRAYALQRFISACAGRGEYPIKFNGSLFTVPYDHAPGDADYRRWGPGYWWQNTRLPYYSMCAAGDFDLMKPLFRMYGEDLMPLFRYRTQRYLHQGGAFIPECIYFWGDMFTETYGWTPYAERTDKLQESRWHKWEWVSGLELVWLMLDDYDHTMDTPFLRRVLLPAAHEILTFFAERYPLDSNGKLLMRPAQACETWWDCTDPMPEIAGLRAVVRRLLSLPAGSASARERAFWKTLEARIPLLPTREDHGVMMLAPAAQFADKQNIENPELYAVFPFRLVAFDTPDRNLGVEAFRWRQDRGNRGWRQDDVFAAYLGLADTAKTYLVGRAKARNADSRFPAFWGPNFDWTPDQDHGSILMKTLQAMVLQTEGKTLFLLPAWPKGWDVEFRLHAPYNTIVEGTYRKGTFKDLRVNPKERAKDIVFPSAP